MSSIISADTGINIKNVMENKTIKLGKYRHYKGKEYKVLGIAKHSETLEKFVVYEELYGQKNFWIRPVDLFLEEIEIGGKKVPRFLFIEK
jgi:hypothetical protein